MVGVVGDVGAAAGSGYGGDRADGGSAGAGAHLVGVSAITADVGAVVVLAAIPVPASALVAVTAPAVIVLVAAALGVAAVLAGGCFSAVAAAIPAGAVATVPVLF